jgi:CxxC motif-containing protein
MLEKRSVGESVSAYCTKCRQVNDHVIVAMGADGETLEKVRCRSCGSSHKYRPSADVKSGKAEKKKEDAVKTAERLWESCLAEARGEERMYEMSAKYRIGDIVIHNTFGKGVVRKIYVNKCDVLFKDKERLMASAN